MSFYEKRVEILKALEKKEMLRAFRVEERFVDAQLFESRDLLSVRQDGLELHLFSPDAEPERAMQAVEVALGGIVPKAPRQIAASFQFIVQIDLEFQEAIDAGYGSVLGSLQTKALKLDDWALLADIYLEKEDADGVAEFGIITKQEAPRRLMREAGRAMGERARAQAKGRWNEADFPDVSVFVDGSIRKPLKPDAKVDLMSTALSFLAASRAALSEFSEDLIKMLKPNEIGKVKAG